MLKIENLHVSVEDKPILKGLSLEIKAGEVHAIMGPNGSGKSTLSYVLAGRDGYEVTDGSILFDGQEVLDMDPEDRAVAGLFLAFQYPQEIPGVPMTTFLRTSINAMREARGQDALDSVGFLKLVREKATALGIRDEMLKRGVNAGFSGGEKKRNEVLQMTLLDPRLVVMDETDSGLDIDAMKIVAEGVNALRSDNRSFLVITHYQRLLTHIVPDVVHILADGQIIKTGGRDIAETLEAEGYAAFGIQDAA